jgi:hypothetical protein
MSDKHIAILVSLITAFLYWVGWLYLYHYHYYLGVDVIEVNPSVQYTLVFSFPALLHLISPRGELCIFLTILLAAGGLFFVIHLKARESWFGRNIMLLMAISFSLLMLAEGYRSAKSLARIKAIDKWMNDSNPAFVEFPSKATDTSADASSVPDNFLAKKLAAANSQLDLRHILSTQQFHYLFAREDCDTNVYEMCGGYSFRVRAPDATVTILHPGEARHGR